MASSYGKIVNIANFCSQGSMQIMDEIRYTCGTQDSVLSALSAAIQEFLSHFQLLPFCCMFFLNKELTFQYAAFPYFLFPHSLSFHLTAQISLTL